MPAIYLLGVVVVVFSQTPIYMNSSDQNTREKELLTHFALTVVSLYFFINGIMSSTGFLIPITVSILLVLICIPLARKLENLGLS